jgi:hypothetical protein
MDPAGFVGEDHDRGAHDRNLRRPRAHECRHQALPAAVFVSDLDPELRLVEEPGASVVAFHEHAGVPGAGTAEPLDRLLARPRMPESVREPDGRGDRPETRRCGEQRE